uniref:Uncharacterized protein n=1 Tax=Ascaris lumbricoides TaxID=6252 RepID=A0A9J2Q0H4_ASCLU
MEGLYGQQFLQINFWINLIVLANILAKLVWPVSLNKFFILRDTFIYICALTFFSSVDEEEDVRRFLVELFEWDLCSILLGEGIDGPRRLCHYPLCLLLHFDIDHMMRFQFSRDSVRFLVHCIERAISTEGKEESSAKGMKKEKKAEVVRGRIVIVKGLKGKSKAEKMNIQLWVATPAAAVARRKITTLRLSSSRDILSSPELVKKALKKYGEIENVRLLENGNWLAL